MTALTLNYTVDTATAHTMIQEMMTAPRALQRLSTAASVSLSAIAMLVGMLSGFVISFYTGLSDMAFAVLPIALGLACVLVCYLWARRVNAQVRQAQINVMQPGTPVSYSFDASGFALTTWYQTWHTRWAGVTDMRSSDTGIVIVCGLFGFVIPRAALGEDPSAITAQINSLWTTHK